MIPRLIAAAATALVLLAHGFARADTATAGSRTHDGTYVGLAIGAGYVHGAATTSATGLVDASSKQGAAEISTSVSGVALSGHVLVGGTPLPGLAVGGGHIGNILFGASRTTEGRSKDLHTFTFGVTGPFVDAYPNLHGGFHVLGMVGLADVIEDSTGSAHGLFGFGAALGVGHGLWVTDNWSFGLLARGQFGAVFWSGPQGSTTSSPVNGDLIGKDLSESQTLFGAALLLTATYH